MEKEEGSLRSVCVSVCVCFSLAHPSPLVYDYGQFTIVKSISLPSGNVAECEIRIRRSRHRCENFTSECSISLFV